VVLSFVRSSVRMLNINIVCSLVPSYRQGQAVAACGILRSAEGHAC
jgi:hypothetical protein